MGLAARGSRQLDDEVEQIEDAVELAQVRRQARGVQLKSLVAGVLLTGLALLLPRPRA
jgi:hypothetical protein